MAPHGARPAALQDPRRRGDPPPLRRLEHVLRVGARPVDDLHLRLLPDAGRDAGGGPGQQVRPGRPQDRAEAGDAAARRRLRLGRHGPARREALRRQGARGDAVPRAGDLGPGGDRARGAVRPGRGPVHGLPRRARGRLRRGQLDRADRAHRREELPGVLRVPEVPAPPGRPDPEPLASPGRTTSTTGSPAAASSTATSSRTASWPAPATSSRRCRTPASRCATRRACASTTR